MACVPWDNFIWGVLNNIFLEFTERLKKYMFSEALTQSITNICLSDWFTSNQWSFQYRAFVFLVLHIENEKETDFI